MCECREAGGGGKLKTKIMNHFIAEDAPPEWTLT